LTTRIGTAPVKALRAMPGAPRKGKATLRALALSVLVATIVNSA